MRARVFALDSEEHRLAQELLPWFVNETLGADEAARVAAHLEQCSRCQTDAAMQAESVGEKILSSLGKPYQFSGYTHNGSASIGATLFGDSQESFEEPLKRADFAMCQAKAAGRNTLRFFYG